MPIQHSTMEYYSSRIGATAIIINFTSLSIIHLLSI